MRVEKYQYRSFDEAEAAIAAMRVAKQEAEEESRRIPENLLEEVRKQYYDSGYAQGLHDGAEAGRNSTLEEAAKQTETAVQSAVSGAVTSHHKQLEVTLGIITNEIGSALDRLNAEYESEKNSIADLAIAIATKIAGAAIAESPIATIKQHVMDCLKDLRHAPSVIIEVPQELRDMVAAACTGFAAMASYNGIVSVTANSHLSGSDCRVIWQHGKSEHIQQKIIDGISAVLSKHGLSKENGERDGLN